MSHPPTPRAARPRLAPLPLDPVLVERIWGGARLGRLLDKPLPPDARIGETWESATEARIAGGPLAGQTLGAVARDFGPALVGTRARVMDDAPFPLLVKFIDAGAVLSVQVHPDDAYAQSRLAEPFGKTEAWHVIAAEPGAVIYHGLRGVADAAGVVQALERGAIADHLCAVPVRPGDTLFTPAGTVHAIGAGIILYEIQQYSDATFRLYDWDRVGDDGKPRPLHLDHCLATIDPATPDEHTISPQPLDDRGERALLVACRHFALELRRLRDPQAGGVIATDGGTCHLLTVLAGEAQLHTPGESALAAGPGQTVLLPAAAADYRLEATADARILDAYVPDLVRDVVAPLRARGMPDAEIARLGGGVPAGNDLLPLLNAKDEGRGAKGEGRGR